MFEIYDLDSLHCLSAPGYSDRAMLKNVGGETKLMKDIKMHLIIKRGMRCGRYEPIYYYACVNNEYVNPIFDKNKDKESYIISLDANSLYYTSMCYKLPQGEPKFNNNISEYTHKYTQNLDPNGKYSYTFSVDIHYPKNLHDRECEFPLLTVHVIPKGKKDKKLMSIFYDKYKYTISVLMLKYVLEKGLELIKVHYVIYAEQFKFMEPYILLNNEKRTQCSIKKYKIGVES